MLHKYTIKFIRGAIRVLNGIHGIPFTLDPEESEVFRLLPLQSSSQLTFFNVNFYLVGFYLLFGVVRLPYSFYDESVHLFKFLTHLQFIYIFSSVMTVTFVYKFK